MVVGDIETQTELLVIGAGPGGYTAAIRAAQRGLDVVLVDKEELGGTCLNRGCIPAKALIHASKFHHEIQNWHEIGIEAECENINFSKIMNWKDSVVDELNSGLEHILDREGVTVKQGEARFIDEDTVRIEEEHNAENVKFENAVIATGSQPIEIPGLEYSKEGVISSRGLLSLDEAPEDLVVVGGGYIGMEAATKFAKFGSEVKIVEAADRVLQNFDEEIVNELRESNPEYGDKIFTGVKASGVEQRDGKTVLKAEKDGEKMSLEGDYVLVAAGRTARPVLENLDLENAGLEISDDGFLEVDEQMKTSRDDIMAIGDCIGQPMLAHKAYREGRVAAEVAAGEAAAFDNQYIPKAMYTDPEVAVVGMTPDEARERFDDVMIGKFPFRASGRSLTINQDHGFIRVVASGDEKLQGVQIVGSRASDMIAEATLALEMQAYLDDVINTIHAHPTFPEAFAEACEDARGESIHK
ncbi:dihydrolipoyl dehydrogenase [Candidatus Nanosalina sp. VS9-1]|uniref:dihydrolipoyl dehydrogenase n=1 Tax=Candidatus Nanosalina sp. VS9-1 TaxID=3388566 RepID=UPI0039DF5E99